MATDQTLVGAAELQEMLGVSRQRISQVTTHPDFPAPAAILRMGKVWDLADVRAWADRRGRTLLPLGDSPDRQAGEAKGSPRAGAQDDSGADAGVS